MKVLVTGADGFIGSHLVEGLLENGDSVRAFVCYNSLGSWGWLDTLPQFIKKEIEVVSGDIRDSYFVKEALEGINTAYHLAALIAIPYSYRAPESYIDTNIKGTLNILNAAKDIGLEKLLVTSTSEVYGTAKYVPIDEFHPFQGQSPYSASKIGADRMAEAFYRSFDMDITIVRPFNTYGPRQSARAVIPTIISQLLANKKRIHLGDVSPTRDFVYVKDTVKGFIELSKAGNTKGKEVNIATNKEISIHDLAIKLISLIDKEAEIIYDKERSRPKNSEVERLLGCNNLLHSLTGWRPDIDIDRGLIETIEFIKQNMDKYKYEIYAV